MNQILIPIKDLNLSTRAYNALKRSGIHSVQDLEKKSEYDLLQIKNFGRTCLQETLEVLRRYRQEARRS